MLLLRRVLYSGLTLVLFALVAPLLALSRRGRQRLHERFGDWKALHEGKFIWFHGASMGEVTGLVPLMQVWRRDFPQVKILLTATSVTGLERGQDYADEVRMLPFDSEVFIKRALRGRLPLKFVFSETELWPGLLAYLAVRDVPTFLVNARLSLRSLGRFRLLSIFFVPAIRSISTIVASTHNAAARFVELGADPASVCVVGNAKYDVSPSVKSEDDARRFKQSLLARRDAVLTLGSIRPGEERFWARAIVNYAGKGITFVIAPRHQEKFEYFAQFLTKMKVDFDRFTQLQGKPSNKGVLLFDIIGALEKVYSFSEVVFVGGTLCREYMGHNPLEPAMYSSCVAIGPYGATIAELRQNLLEEDAVVELHSASDVDALCKALVRNSASCRECGRRAHRVWQKHAGATSRIMEVIAR